MINQNINTSLRIIIKGSLIVLCGGAIGQFFNFIFKLIAARHFGPEDYGWFSLALAIIMISGNISDLGLQQSVARFVSYFVERKERKKLQYTIKFGIKILAISSLICSILLIIGASKISEMLDGKSNFKLFLILFAFVIPFLVEFNYSQGILRGMKDMKMMAVANNIFVWLPRLALLGIIYMLDLTIQSMVVPYYVSYIMGLAVVWIYLKKIIPYKEIVLFNKCDQGSMLRNQLIAYSLPLALSGVSSVIRQRFDVIFIGLFLDASQVGLYSVALSLAMLMTVLLVAINRITLPVVTGLFSKDNEVEMGHIYRLLAKWNLMITLPIFFLMLLFPEKIIYFTFGDRYAEAANVLRFLSIGFFVNAVSGSFGEYLQTYGKTKSILIISVTGTAVNFISMVLLIPKFGLVGAAIACSITLSYISLIGNTILYSYKRILFISKHYFYTLLIGISFFLITYFIHSYLFPNLNTFNFIIFILLIVLVYLVLLYLFATDDFDKNIIGSAKLKNINILLKEF